MAGNVLSGKSRAQRRVEEAKRRKNRLMTKVSKDLHRLADSLKMSPNKVYTEMVALYRLAMKNLAAGGEMTFVDKESRVKVLKFTRLESK